MMEDSFKKSPIDVVIDFRGFGILPERPPEKTEKEIEELTKLIKLYSLMYGFSKGEDDGRASL